MMLFAAGFLVGAFSLMIAPSLFEAFVARCASIGAWLKLRF